MCSSDFNMFPPQTMRSIHLLKLYPRSAQYSPNWKKLVLCIFKLICSGLLDVVILVNLDTWQDLQPLLSSLKHSSTLVIIYNWSLPSFEQPYSGGYRYEYLRLPGCYIPHYPGHSLDTLVMWSFITIGSTIY